MVPFRIRALALAACCAGSLAAADPAIWKVAPAPPASYQRDRVADLTAHRKAVMEQIGDKGVLILYAAEPRNYAGDVDWPFRQENNFYYLTGINQTGNALVLIPGAAKYREILFMAPSNPLQENWTGHILLPDEARQISGIDAIWDARLLGQFLTALMPEAKSIFMTESTGGRGGALRGAMTAPPMPSIDWNVEFKPAIDLIAKREAKIYLFDSNDFQAELGREIQLSAQLAKLNPQIEVKDATQMFGSLRKLKSQREIDLLQHAVDITAEAFQRAYALSAAGAPEYEIQAQFEFTFLRRNSHWGYPCTVASGVNATTLHYEANKDTMKAGDLVLMDDAAEFDGYSADVTRTIPVDGKFTKPQADIYRLVWNAQQAGLSKAVPGRTEEGGKDSISAAANDVLRLGLYQLGLITDVNSDQQLRIWFSHGIGHGIGLNVHDLATGQELQPGMVITVEPGIYISPVALDNLPKTPENAKFAAAVRPAFEKYKGIGVRIEDDVLITNGQPKVLSQAVPSQIEEVEDAIAQLRKALKTTPLP